MILSETMTTIKKSYFETDFYQKSLKKSLQSYIIICCTCTLSFDANDLQNFVL